jgi:hypothetical protein
MPIEKSKTPFSKKKKVYSRINSKAKKEKKEARARECRNKKEDILKWQEAFPRRRPAPTVAVHRRGHPRAGRALPPSISD